MADRGIFSDLDDRVQLAMPSGLGATRVSATVDDRHHVLVLYVEGWPVKVYPLTGASRLPVGDIDVTLRPGDRGELVTLLSPDNVTRLAKDAAPAPGDADDDGIPDPLDLLVGGKKTAINQASYGAGYILIDFPMGDVPRDIGVCTDVVIRATRNAGLDIQEALFRDIQRARRSYPMIKKRPNTNIDHRRVKTLLPYFLRQWDQRTAALDDERDPLRPGDVVFMDTFPTRRGPDHMGIVSDTIGDSGHPLIINNWTDGAVTSEMDLLGWVPVTHRFRFRSR